MDRCNIYLGNFRVIFVDIYDNGRAMDGIDVILN